MHGNLGHFPSYAGSSQKEHIAEPAQPITITVIRRRDIQKRRSSRLAISTLYIVGIQQNLDIICHQASWLRCCDLQALSQRLAQEYHVQGLTIRDGHTVLPTVSFATYLLTCPAFPAPILISPGVKTRLDRSYYPC